MSLIKHVLKTGQDIDKWVAVANMLGLTVGDCSETSVTLRKGETLIWIYNHGQISIQDLNADDEFILEVLQRLQNKKDDNNEQ